MTTLRSTLRIAIAVALVFAALTARVIVGGELELAASSDALVRGDVRDATTHARLAAQFYFPGAAHVRVAYGRLLAIGREADTRRLDADARFAFEAVRTAALSTRWLVVPHAEAVDEANRAIAAIDARAPRPPAHADDPPAQIEREALARLATPIASRLAVHVAVAIAFGAMIGGAVFALRRADATGRLPLARARIGLVVALAGLATWVAVLLLA